MNIHLQKVFLMCAVIIFFISCDNTLDLVEDRREIPVVYGLITTSDTAQYIRVERAFIDESISALILAQNPDSLYYPNAKVSLVRESTGATFDLEEIDGNTEGYPREDGVFASSPNTLYKIKTSEMEIASGESYRFELTYNEMEPIVTANTVLLGESTISKPNDSRDVLAIVSNRGFEIRFRSDETATIFDVYLIMEYQEGNIDKSARIDLALGTDEIEFELESDVIFSKIAASIPVIENVVRRYQGARLVVEAGGEELGNYLSVGQANLGITSSQDIPTYTNISQGVGVFSSRNTTTSDLIPELDSRSLDSLINGRFTNRLNFQF